MSSDASSTAHLSAACALPPGHRFNPNKAEFPPSPLSLEKTCLSKEEAEVDPGHLKKQSMEHIIDELKSRCATRGILERICQVAITGGPLKHKPVDEF